MTYSEGDKVVLKEPIKDPYHYTTLVPKGTTGKIDHFTTSLSGLQTSISVDFGTKYGLRRVKRRSIRKLKGG